MLRPRDLDPHLRELVHRHQGAPDPMSTITAVVLKADGLGVPAAAVRHYLSERGGPQVRQAVGDFYRWKAILRRARRARELRADACTHVERGLAHLLRRDLPEETVAVLAWLIVEGVRRAPESGTEVMASAATIAVELGISERTVRRHIDVLVDVCVLAKRGRRQGEPMLHRVRRCEDCDAREAVARLDDLVDATAAGKPTIVTALASPVLGYGDGLRPRDFHIVLLLRAGVIPEGGDRTERRVRARLRDVGLGYGSTDEEMCIALDRLEQRQDDEGLTPLDRLHEARERRETRAQERLDALAAHRELARRAWDAVNAALHQHGRPPAGTALRAWATKVAPSVRAAEPELHAEIAKALGRVITTSTGRPALGQTLSDRIMGRAAHKKKDDSEEAA